MTDLWTYRAAATPTALRGLSVEALDGEIGAVDEASEETGGSYVIVDTGPWIFGKKVMLPAGVISEVDLDRQVIVVNRTKAQIKNAPEFDESRRGDREYQSSLGSYYGPGGAGYRDPH
jgi:hypothetical protein